MSIEVINPAKNEKINSFKEHTLEEVNHKIESADLAFKVWKKTSFRQRAENMVSLAHVLRKNKQELSGLMAMEMGKTIREGLQEIEKCAGTCEYYAEHAEMFLKPEIVNADSKKCSVVYQPLGVVLAIMPWNFPFWQVFRFLAPGLMSGNAVVLKHSSNVPGCAMAIEGLLKNAGFPENLFHALLIPSSRVEKVIEHKLIRAVTLTGSTQAGKNVAAKAGQELKKTVLELGGSDAYIILEDADLEKAVEICVNSRLINTGQSCIAAKRFIVVESVMPEFEKRFVELMKQKTIGDPFDEKVDLGPLARIDLRDLVHEQVKESINKGAKCLLGGVIPEYKGAFYPPTVLTGVKKGMPAFDEEIFGPVAALISAGNEQEAIKLANDSIYGLGGAIFTKDIEKGERLALQMESGSCFVNTLVRSDPRLPFGGVKGSGYGRELSYYGIKEFVNIKSICIAD